MFGGFNGEDSTILGSTFENMHDASLHFVSKLADRRLQLDVIAGYHYDEQHQHAGPGGDAAGAFYQPVESLARVRAGREPVPAADAQRRRRPFNPARCRTTPSAASTFLDHKRCSASRRRRRRPTSRAWAARTR